ncbi:hypothetical protein GGR50DRAFT_599681 [Xylaria sp. CBS 124048]|nr:hypothetical protein GGR50DRAFT_599681 [Xylaria sp. CBS 124048]
MHASSLMVLAAGALSAVAQTTPEAYPQSTPEAWPQTAAQTSPEMTSQASLQMAPQTSSQMAPQTTPQLMQEPTSTAQTTTTTRHTTITVTVTACHSADPTCSLSYTTPYPANTTAYAPYTARNSTSQGHPGKFFPTAFPIVPTGFQLHATNPAAAGTSTVVAFPNPTTAPIRAGAVSLFGTQSGLILAVMGLGTAALLV